MDKSFKSVKCSKIEKLFSYSTPIFQVRASVLTTYVVIALCHPGPLPCFTNIFSKLLLHLSDRCKRNTSSNNYLTTFFLQSNPRSNCCAVVSVFEFHCCQQWNQSCSSVGSKNCAHSCTTVGFNNGSCLIWTDGRRGRQAWPAHKAFFAMDTKF